MNFLRLARTLIGSLVLLLFAANANAANFCRNKKTQAVYHRGRCLRGEIAVDLSQMGALGPQGPQGTPGQTGAAGPQGDPGADGQLRVYGDGSAGDRTISATEDWTSTEVENLQFENLTIESGGSLTVPSGTVIRCRGSFTNDGSISVSRFASGDSGPAHPGISRRAASDGVAGTSGGTQEGGAGGLGVGGATARSILLPGPAGGGAGGRDASGAATSGGGTIVVLAKGALSNVGSISASSGSAAGGGGAGGIVILASMTSLSHSGVIFAGGGSGADSTTSEGAGGGGAGGIVHFLAPAIANTGSVHLIGGAHGGTTVSPTDSPRRSGPGGAACVGSGGNGATVTGAGGAQSFAGNQAGNGGSGVLLESEVDPTSLF